jgi:steroid delta-isomerase-like uncharacterized protein
MQIAAILLFVAGCSGLVTYLLMERKSMNSEQNKEVVIRLIDEVWSKGKLDMVDELVAPQYTLRHDPGDPWNGKTLDIDTYKERVNHSRTIISDQQFHITDAVADENKVAVSWHFTGKHAGSMPGLPATNKPIDVSGLTIYYLADGKVTGHWQVVDRLGFIGQIGLPTMNK